MSQGTQLRLQRYVQQLDTTYLSDEEALASRLCPLLAQSEKQQQQFYTIFHQWWQDEIAIKEQVVQRRNPIWQLLGLLAGLMFVLCTVYLLYRVTPEPQAPEAKMWVEACDTDALTASFRNLSDSNAKFQWNFGDGKVDSVHRELMHTYSQEGNQTIQLIVWNENGRDTLTEEVYINGFDSLRANFSFREIEEHQYVFSPNQKDENLSYLWDFGDGNSETVMEPIHTFASDEAETVVTLEVRERADTRGECAERHSESLEIKQKLIPLIDIHPVRDTSRGTRHWTLFGRWGMAALTMLPFLFLLYLRRNMLRNQKDKALEEQEFFEKELPLVEGKEPPFEVPFPRQGHLLSAGTNIYKLAKALRQRRMSDRTRLDVIETVKASTKQAGMPDLRYRSESMAAEYLVLIEQISPYDQQAKLFAQLMELLRNEEVPIDLYYYHNDLRYCYAENSSEPLSLPGLYKLYPKHRLLIFGTGDVLLDPYDLSLQDWVREEVGLWEEKALLTPEPAGNWSSREQALFEHFVILPADIQSQLDLVEALVSEEQPDFRLLRRRLRRQEGQEAHPPGLDFYDAGELEGWLGDEHFRWLAATALYPRPYWELTLRVGRALGILTEDEVMPEPTYRTLLKLSRIPWLQDGNLPPALRAALIDSLSYEDEWLGRQAILDLLENSPTSPTSFIHQERETQRIINEAQLYPGDPEKQRALLTLQAHNLLDPVMSALIQRGDQKERRAQVELVVTPKPPPYMKWVQALMALTLFFPIIWLSWTFFDGAIPEDTAWEGSRMVRVEVDSAAYYNDLGINWLQQSAYDSARHMFSAAIDFASRQSDQEIDTTTGFVASLHAGFESYPPGAFNDRLAWFREAKFVYEERMFVFARGGFEGNVDILSWESLQADDNRSKWYSVDTVKKALWANMYAVAASYFYEGELDSARTWTQRFVDESQSTDLPVELLALLREQPSINSRRDSTNVVGAEELFAQANQAYEATDYRQALGWLNQIILKYPSDPLIDRAYLLRGRTYTNLNYFARAQKDLLRLNRTGNELRVEALWGLYFNAERQKDTLNVRAALARLTSYGTPQDSVEAVRLLANWEAPAEEANQALTLLNNAKRNYDEKNYTEALTQLSTYISNYAEGEGMLEALSLRGLIFLDQGNYNLALNDVKRVYSQPGPFQFRAYYAAYLCYFELENYAQADEMLKAIQRIPNLSSDEIDLYTATRESLDDFLNRNDITFQLQEDRAPSDEIPLPNMILVPGGTFWMGSDKTDKTEAPQHQVSVNDFYMSETEVTNEMFMAFLNAKGNRNEGGAPWYDSGMGTIREIKGSFHVEGNYSDHPVVGVSWYGAKAYCAWLNEIKANGRTRWRLPSEAEWEYAAIGGGKGTDTGGYTKNIYAGSNDIDRVAWYSENSREGTHSVSQKMSNELGLYDMSGNVWEWCEDDWHENYQGAPSSGIAWVGVNSRSNKRIVRGGSWFDFARGCRVSLRSNRSLDFQDRNIGIRLCASGK